MKRNGCHDRPPLGRVRPVQDGHETLTLELPGQPRVQWVAPRYVSQKFAMTTDCQYTHTDAGRVDPGCEGGRWRSST